MFSYIFRTVIGLFLITAFFASLVWLYRTPGWDPFITALLAFVAFINFHLERIEIGAQRVDTGDSVVGADLVFGKLNEFYATIAAIRLSAVSSALSVPAAPTGKYGITYLFDVTNPKDLDVGINKFYVTVIAYLGVSQYAKLKDCAFKTGGSAPIVRLDCRIKPHPGQYACDWPGAGSNFIKLSKGEMQRFFLIVVAGKPGLYKFKIGVEYSVGGEQKSSDLNDEIQLIEFFDGKPVKER